MVLSSHISRTERHSCRTGGAVFNVDIETCVVEDLDAADAGALANRDLLICLAFRVSTQARDVTLGQ